jgi:MoaA/NifB/PqqE/SkfB family radical SAM enzyme
LSHHLNHGIISLLKTRDQQPKQLHTKKMMFLNRIIHRGNKRPLKALQVEVTSRCTRSCVVCPRSIFKNRWREGDLDEALWKVLEPDLSLVEYVYLQGWGEPLLHPALPRWARAAGKAGCKVGLTTNGEGLHDALDWLKEGNVDLVTVSVAGNERINRDLRDGLELGRALEAAGELVQLARRMSLKTKVQLSYLLTRQGASSVSAVVEMAARFSLDAFFIIHLDCRPSRSLRELSAFSEVGLSEGISGYLGEAEKTAERMGISYRGPALYAEEVLTCALDPLRFAFLSWDGRIGPCVNLLLPIEGSIPRWGETEKIRVEPVYYGHLGEERLSVLLSSESRRRFTTPFRERLNAERTFLSSLELGSGSQALGKLEKADEVRNAELISNAFPDACEACPKKLGW